MGMKSRGRLMAMGLGSIRFQVAVVLAAASLLPATQALPRGPRRDAPSTSPPPTVTSVTPGSGPTGGGTNVTIKGANFVQGMSLWVYFGSTPSTAYSFVDTSTLQAYTPAHTAGAVDVTVVNPDQQSGTLTDGFTYTASGALPYVSSVTPNYGPPSGGTQVALTGSAFSGATAVSFSGTPATSFAVVSDSYLTAVSPPHAAGTVNVLVTNPLGTNAPSSANQFTFSSNPPPAVTSVSPNSGPTEGGTTVTVSGNYLSGATAVAFGDSAAASFSVLSSTSLSAVSPTHATGVVDITVTTPDGTSARTASDQFTFTSGTPAPTVASVSPTSGPVAGGTSVTVTGANFASGATVTFGGTPATGVSFVGSTSLACTTPAHAAGTVSVMVTNPNGQNGTLAGGFTYTSSTLSITGISPASGSTAGGTAVTISGSNFQPGAAVTVGGASATGVAVVSVGAITCVTPAHAAGPADVTVTNPDQQSATLAGGFTYVSGSCGLICSAAAPDTAAAGTAVPFQGSAVPAGCAGQPAYLWTFGDGTTSEDQNPRHSYDAPGTYSWSVAASLELATCSAYGSITVTPGVAPPVVTGVKAVSTPFRLKVSGINFHAGCTVEVDGTPVPISVFKTSELVVAKSGAALKAMVPKGVTVQITVTNTDDGGVSDPFSYTR